MRIVLFLCLLLASGGKPALGQQIIKVAPDFARFVEEPVPPVAVPASTPYRFGYLEVPENRSRDSSNLIRLPVYLFSSRSASPQPEPLIYTVGGPGYSSLNAARYMQYYRYLDDRDLILFEQRGTAYAQPALNCPEWAAVSYQERIQSITQTEADSLYRIALQDCSTRWRAAGTDLNGYRTTETATDIEALRQALSIEQYHFLGISYSTKIAQVLLRDYPAGVKTVIMDSALPLEVSYDEESTANQLNSLKGLLADCSADSNCAAAFPNLESRLLAYLRDRSLQPLGLYVLQEETGDSVRFSLDGAALFGYLSSTDYRNMPLSAGQLLQGDYSGLRAYLARRFNGPGPGTGLGMRLSVWCAEETPFADRQTIKRERERYPEVSGLSPAVFEPDYCGIWGVQAAAVLEDEPVPSDKPVLFINGSMDGITPARWATAMRPRFPQSQQLIFEGWGHTPSTNWGNPCAMTAIRQFMNSPHQQPQPPCLKQIGKIEFVTTEEE